MSEPVELQTAFARRQAELTVENLRALREQDRTVAEEVTKPGHKPAARAMAGFRAA